MTLNLHFAIMIKLNFVTYGIVLTAAILSAGFVIDHRASALTPGTGNNTIVTALEVKQAKDKNDSPSAPTPTPIIDPDSRQVALSVPIKSIINKVTDVQTFSSLAGFNIFHDSSPTSIYDSRSISPSTTKKLYGSAGSLVLIGSILAAFSSRPKR